MPRESVRSGVCCVILTSRFRKSRKPLSFPQLRLSFTTASTRSDTSSWCRSCIPFITELQRQRPVGIRNRGKRGTLQIKAIYLLSPDLHSIQIRAADSFKVPDCLRSDSRVKLRRVARISPLKQPYVACKQINHRPPDDRCAGHQDPEMAAECQSAGHNPQRKDSYDSFQDL